MIKLSRGDVIPLKNILHHGDKLFVKLGSRMIEAHMDQQLKPGEKLLVTSISDTKIILKPYSLIFKDMALTDMLKNLGLPQNNLSRNLVQLMLAQGKPLNPEQILALLNKLKTSDKPEKLLPLLLEKELPLEPGLFSKIESEKPRELLLFFLSLSRGGDVLLPLDNQGHYAALREDSAQLYFHFTLSLPKLQTLYVKGYLSKNLQTAEAFVFFQPFLDLRFFAPIQKRLEQTFPQFKITARIFEENPYRSIDGFF